MNRNARPSYEFGPFRLDPSEHLLLKHGQPVVLTPKVFQVLRVLVQNAGHLVEKDRLLTEVWADSFVEEGALSRSVSILRKALGERTSGEHYIQTVPTLGYRFVAPVIERFDDSSRSSGLESSTQSAVESRRGVFSRAAGIAGLGTDYRRARLYGFRTTRAGDDGGSSDAVKRCCGTQAGDVRRKGRGADDLG